MRSGRCEQGVNRLWQWGSRDRLDVVCPTEGVLESLLVPIPHDLVACVAEGGAELIAAVEELDHRDRVLRGHVDSAARRAAARGMK